MAAPPIETPTPDAAELRAPSTATRHDTKDVPVTVGVLRQANRFTRVLMFIAGSGIGVGSAFGGGWLALGAMRAEAQVVADAGVARAEKAAETVAKQQEQRISMLEKGQLQQADDVRETKTEVKEVKQDLRDLKRTIDAIADKLRVTVPNDDGGR